MKKKIISLLFASTLLVTALTSCGGGGGTTDPSKDEPSKSSDKQTESSVDETPDTTKDDTPDDTDPAGALAYTGDLELMHFSTSEEAEGNGGSDGFRTMLANWKAANPGINLIENVLANAEYKTQIATLSTADGLPDVFLLQGMNTIDWADQGLVYDLTSDIKSSPYYGDYTLSYFDPFTVGDSIYGYPALTGGTCTVVIYDKAMWADAGFDSFPETWADVESAVEHFSAQGIDTISFGNGGKWQANSCFLSTLGNRYTGPDWFMSLVAKGGAAFTDDEFVAALAETQRLFAETDIFNADYNAVTNEDAREYFIAGDSAAFIGGNWDEAYIWAVLKEDNEEKFNNMGFAVLPQPGDATKAPKSQNIGLGYAMSVSQKIAGDADKLEAAIDLAEYTTGPDFANYVAENYALGGLTSVPEVDLSAFDPITQAFYNWSYVDTETCEIYDSYLTNAVWDVLNTDLQTLMNGEITPEEVAENAQNAYVNNY